MAVVTTSTVDGGNPTLWDIPPEIAGRGVPRGKIEYNGVTTIPATVAADSSVFVLSLTLPPGFVYKLTVAEFVAEALALATLNEFSQLMTMTINLDAINVRTISMVNAESAAAGFFGGSRIQVFLPPPSQNLSSQIIAASAQSTTLRLEYTDPAVGVRAAVTVRHNFEVLQFTPEQFNEWPMNSPVPVF